jgi:hypothetical protein
MVRLSSPKRKILSQEDFEQYPVWTWDDDNENRLPVDDIEPSWDEYDTYFIKAIFKTQQYVFNGYLVGDKSFYTIHLFINNGNKFGFNRNMPDFVDKTLAAIFQSLNCKPFPFFPVQYESPVRFKDWGPIKGTWDPATGDQHL